MSVFRVVETEIKTGEQAYYTLYICLEMVTNGPLLESVIFDLVPQNASASGE